MLPNAERCADRTNSSRETIGPRAAACGGHFNMVSNLRFYFDDKEQRWMMAESAAVAKAKHSRKVRAVRMGEMRALVCDACGALAPPTSPAQVKLDADWQAKEDAERAAAKQPTQVAAAPNQNALQCRLADIESAVTSTVLARHPQPVAK